jgi:hypothetical protein
MYNFESNVQEIPNLCEDMLGTATKGALVPS